MKIVLKNTNYTENRPRINRFIPEFNAKEVHLRERFLVVKGQKHISLKVGNVAYFIVESRITTAVTFSNERYLLNMSLDKLEEELDTKTFFRTNRSTIINIDAFDYFENYFGGKLIVKLKKSMLEPIPISRVKAPAFKQWLDC